MIALEVLVPGVPVPQGSMRLVQGGRRMIHSNPALPAWRALVTNHTVAAIVRKVTPFPLTGPVDLSVTFNFPRPRHHYRTGKYSDLLRDTAPRYMSVGPDLDKLVRAVGDSLTDACAIVDDKQLHIIHASKRWSEGDPYCTITLWNGDDHR